MGVLSDTTADARESKRQESPGAPPLPVELPDPFLFNYDTEEWHLDWDTAHEAATVISLMATAQQLMK